MMYLLLGYLAFQFTLMYSILQKNNLLGWWGTRMGILLGIVVAVMGLVFLVAKKIHRIDLVDAAWAWAAMAAVIASFVMQRRTGGHLWDIDAQLLVTVLVCLWGIRLSIHIIRRIRSTKEEDPRYVELRKQWKGNDSANMFVRIYLLQALLVLLVAMPAIHTELFFDFQPRSIQALSLVGLGIWLVGFVCELIADRQLRRFKADSKNKGKIMDRGLWRYSRHPNYFGELMQWWGIYVICLSVPVGWIFGLIGPIILTYLLIFVSGVPATEKRFEGREGWKKYKASTSAIIPLPHRQ